MTQRETERHTYTRGREWKDGPETLGAHRVSRRSNTLEPKEKGKCENGFGGF